MEQGIELTGLAVVAAAATVCGMVMARLNQPAIVGYILAGIILGPSGLGLVEDRGQIASLAELGVLMLLYIIGMELSVRSFRRMWRIAVFSTGLQVLVSLVAMLFLGYALGWPMAHVILFAFVLALSSTAVAVKMMEDVGALRRRTGRIAVGVLIAQDLAVAPMMIVLAGLVGDGFDMIVFLEIVVAVVLLVGLIRYLARDRKISLPFATLVLGKLDLRPVAALAWCFAAAAVAGFIGISAVFGAFLAGLVVGSSHQRHEFFEAAKPIESILLMTFFLSIGLLIDLNFLWNNLGLVLVLWAFVTVFKTVLNAAIFRAMGETWQHAFLSGLFLAQIGEFGFILGGVALDSSIINTDLYRLVVAVTVFSLVTSPIWMNSARRVQHRAAARMETLGGLLRLVYFREWRFTRRNSRVLFDALYWVLTRAEIMGNRARRNVRERLRQRRKELPPNNSTHDNDA
ncbi:MAG: Iron transporter MagA [Alphaproteobacteria bacterium MarineAlpha4_Bin2]|nr:MAG: Iron transporter MagA [Alphaproteobacteria bacterium MarineAlpha4_Bin2]